MLVTINDMSAYNVMITKKEVVSMNLSTLALLLLAWQMLGNSQKTQQSSPPPQIGLTDFLNDDTKNILNCVNMLSSKQCSQEDKTNAIFQMMANPAVMNLASNLFAGGGQRATQNSEGYRKPDEQSNVHTQQKTDEHVNSEGYRFETPSEGSQQFFRQIDNIADAEVKHKLYWFYDNWYVK